MEVLELAHKYKKKVFFYDDEHVKLLNIVDELGYYKIPKDIILSTKSFTTELACSLIKFSLCCKELLYIKHFLVFSFKSTL